MAYTTQHLVDQVRIDLDDVVTPFLLTDNHIVRALDEAQTEFVEQTLCLYDASSTALQVTTAQWVTVPSQVLRIRAVIRPNGEVIRPTTLAEMEYGFSRFGTNDEHVPTWRALTGAPRFAVTDMELGKLRFVPTPTTPETAQIEAFVTPDTLALDSSPTVPDRWRKDLIVGALARIYSMQDTELYDPEAAMRYAQEWDKALLIAVETLDRDQRDITRRFRLPRTLERNTSVLAGRAKAGLQQQKVPAKANGNNAAASE